MPFPAPVRPVGAPAPAVLRAAVERDAAEAGFTLNGGQRAALERLLAPAGGGAGPDAGRLARSVYVWGPAGRGKTWLLDAVYRALPLEQKKRVHFHDFFDELHRAIHRNRAAPDALHAALAELLHDARLLFFDEFHVHDSGDAMLLTRVLRHLFESDVTLIATSNYAPAELLPDPLWHHLFEPAIALIDQNMDVVELLGPTDHRLDRPRAATGFGAGVWLQESELAASGLTAPTPAEAGELVLNGRRFPVSALRDGELWITFDQLCDSPTSTTEYVDWSTRFSRWVITGVPAFTDTNVSAQQRFITVIDVLSTQNTQLVVSAQLGRGAFIRSAGGRPDAFRMISRLHLLGAAAPDREARPLPAAATGGRASAPRTAS